MAKTQAAGQTQNASFQATMDALPTITSLSVDELQDSYFQELFPGTLAVSVTTDHLSKLFNDPQLNDLNWYSLVTIEMNTLLMAVVELDEIHVPNGCEICKEIHTEFSIMRIFSMKADENWTDWLEYMDNVSHLEDMILNTLQVQAAFRNAKSILDEGLD